MKQKIESLENYVNELKEIVCQRDKELKVWKSKCELFDLRNNQLNSQLAERKSEYDVLIKKHKHAEELLNSHIQKANKKEKDVEALQSKIMQVCNLSILILKYCSEL